MPWWARAAALTIDVLPGAAVLMTMALAAAAVPQYGPWWWSFVSAAGLTILLIVGNRWLLPAATGWSLGRAALNITLVRSGDAAMGSVGVRRLLLRDLAHLLDTASVLVGWLWPLWDRRRRTFADMLAHTEVRRARLPRLARNIPMLVALAFLTAALVCTMGAAASYLVVYQNQQSSNQARAQIALQGPKIIERMLSYRPDSLEADFADAQSLVTDNYREQLKTEQQAVEKGKPVSNEYRVINSAVLSAAPHRAVMLLMMQGQRGDEKAERLISATVRVSFAESAAQWRVDDLTVVTKPLPAQEGS
ncbi:MAG: RDD family protein [Mycobacterium sp.]